MFFKKRIDAYDFGEILAEAFLQWVNSGKTRLSKNYRKLNDSELHIFVTKWMIACAGFIGAAFKDNSTRMAVLSSYAEEICIPTRKGGYDLDPMEVMKVGSPQEASKYLVSDGYGDVCANECAKILKATFGNEISDTKAKELATRNMISDFGACHRLILFLLQRYRVVYRRPKDIAL